MPRPFSSFLTSCEECIEKILQELDDLKKEFPTFEEIKHTADLYFHKLPKKVQESLTNTEFNTFVYFLKEKYNERKQLVLDSLYKKQQSWAKYHFERYFKVKHSELPFWPIYIQLFCAACCFTLSAVFHLYYVHSPRVAALLARLDYAGISFLIAGSCFPPYFYHFYCDIELRNSYLIMIVSFSAVVFFFSMSDKFASTEYIQLRGSIFVALGLSTTIPFIHLYLLTSNIVGALDDFHMFKYGLGGLTYIFGATLYMMRIPERLYPGTFDKIGNSHNIFHVMVVLANFIVYLGAVDLYYERLFHQC